MQGKINYSNALAIFLHSAASYQYKLTATDISYLYVIANYQNLSHHICKVPSKDLAREARISLMTLRRTEKKLLAFGLIQVKRIWKINWIILSEKLAPIPIEWRSARLIHTERTKNNIKYRNDTREELSSITMTLDQVSQRYSTIEKVEKENINTRESRDITKNMGTEAKLTKPSLSFFYDQETISYIQSRGLDFKTVNEKFLNYALSQGKRYADQNAALRLFASREKAATVMKSSAVVTLKNETFARREEYPACEKCGSKRNPCRCKYTADSIGSKTVKEMLAKLSGKTLTRS